MEAAAAIVDEHCKKLVRNLHYKARLIAIRAYKASQGFRMKSKKPAREIFLQKEEYMQVKYVLACYFLNWLALNFFLTYMRCN